MDTPDQSITPASPPPAPPSPPPSGSGSYSSSSSVMALILGILSLLCCGFFTGIPAFFIGRSELKAIDNGQIHESNRTMAKIGMICGLIGTLLSLLGFLVWAFALIMGISSGMLYEMR